ncbi:hypothetical protein D8M35_01725 [Curtobacterium sp. HSID17257]|jgi:hypothetical protein|nr:hypothetical protein D8M35_01725 [Curtobacterium sp. HSID17257]
MHEEQTQRRDAEFPMDPGREACMKMEKFAARVPSFADLMGGAFNQDWRDEWDSAEEIVTSVLGERTDQLRSMLKDLRRIDQVCSDDDIDLLLFSLGSGFSPETDWGMSPKGWVQDFEVRLERELVARGDASD